MSIANLHSYICLLFFIFFLDSLLLLFPLLWIRGFLRVLYLSTAFQYTFPFFLSFLFFFFFHWQTFKRAIYFIPKSFKLASFKPVDRILIDTGIFLHCKLILLQNHMLAFFQINVFRGWLKSEMQIIIITVIISEIILKFTISTTVLSQ